MLLLILIINYVLICNAWRKNMCCGVCVYNTSMVCAQVLTGRKSRVKDFSDSLVNPKCIIWLNVEKNIYFYSGQQKVFYNIYYYFLLLFVDNDGILSTTFAASKLLCCLLTLLAIQQPLPLLREPPEWIVGHYSKIGGVDLRWY